jgi:hypothetical protein
LFALSTSQYELVLEVFSGVLGSQKKRNPPNWHVNPGQQGGNLGSAHGLPLIEQKPAVPVPLRETVCGLPGALSVTERVPLRLPVALGVKVTLTVQRAPAANELPQV